jgi:Glycosyltransferase sugar-binding region containing DXD motif
MGKHIPQHKLKLREEQRVTLAQNGYNIRDIESLARDTWFLSTTNPNSPINLKDLNKASSKAYSDFANGLGYDGIKYFSDLARLLYLHEVGGIHMDVDLGLGEMDLNQTYYQNDPAGRVPLMGSILRSSDDKAVIALLNKLEQFNQSGFYKNSESGDYLSVIEQIMQQAVNGAGMYNALIGTRRKNPHIAMALFKFMSAFEHRKDLPTGMQFNRYLLLGDKETSQHNYQNAAAMSVPPYLLALRHLTPESDV